MRRRMYCLNKHAFIIFVCNREGGGQLWGKVRDTAKLNTL
jgi:hypothetical protein